MFLVHSDVLLIVCVGFTLVKVDINIFFSIFDFSYYGSGINYFRKDGLVYGLLAKASQMKNDSVLAIIVTASKDLDVVIL
jgi:hypothetical protein